MCGRFTLRTPAADWCQLFLIDPGDLPAGAGQLPRYNIAPTQQVLAVIRPEPGESRRLESFRWGLLPSWADDPAIGNRMINARGETVAIKPAFRSAFRSRRCLIPADGYYEWRSGRDGKQPVLIEAAGGGVMALAGLWEENAKLGEDGRPLRSCTIITTDANRATAEIHDRMPVLIDPAEHDRWLDPHLRDPSALRDLLRPAPDDALRLTPVSRHVNNPRNEDARCVEPVEEG